MADLPTFLLFLTASAVLVVTPGPAVIYIVTRTISQGRAAGLASVAGVTIGNFVHVIAAVGGLTALVASSSLAFTAVRYLGAAYLVYLGARKLLGAAPLPSLDTPLAAPSSRQAFRDAIVVATLNPKTALFFLAFLPQFTDPAKGAVGLQVLMLGSITVTMGAISDSIYALLSGALGGWIRRSPRFLQVERYAVGATYCGLGIAALWSGAGRRG